MDYVLQVMLGQAAGGGGGTLPTTGLLGWWKADAGVTKDGSNAVSQWDDQSGNGKHLTMATAARQPPWVASVLNGLPGIRFDSGDGLNFPIITGIYSFFVVVTYPTSTFSNNSVLISGNVAGTPSWYGDSATSLWTTNPLDGLYRRNGVVRATSESISPLNASHYIVGYSTGTKGVNGQTLGNWTGSFDNNWTGHVHELAFWNYQLSGGDVTTVESYAVSRYGSL